jgi:DNA-binding response OmpR family regulator
MYKVAIVSTKGDANPTLVQGLEKDGLAYTVVLSTTALSLNGESDSIDAVLFEFGACDSQMLSSTIEWCQNTRIPLLCGLPAGNIWEYDISWGTADFFLMPPHAGEITARIKQAQQHQHRVIEEISENIIHVGNIRINIDRYEVSSRGKRVLLTFKEYQLLTVLISNPGRVYSRETLLNQIWGYDYFGGTRTVDVHIRRLRSKIEDVDQGYIETVRNVGYRFRLVRTY